MNLVAIARFAIVICVIDDWYVCHSPSKLQSFKYIDSLTKIKNHHKEYNFHLAGLIASS
jgi:hypothetical protein